MRLPFPVLILMASSLSTSCSSLLYHPTFIEHFPPEKMNLHPEPLWIRSGNGNFLYGWYFHTTSQKTPKATLIFFHGNAENISSHYLALTWILSKGYDFFIFDYGGYGRSQGSPSPESTLSDGKSVLRKIYDKDNKIPIVLFGQSLGGAVALRTAIEMKNEIPIQLIVVDSSFLSYRGAARSVLASHWITWIFQPLSYLLFSDSTAPVERVQELSPIPLVVIHGEKDQIIDISLGEEIFRLAKEPKEFWRVPNGTHIDSFWNSSSNIRDRLLTKLDRLFKKSSERH